MTARPARPMRDRAGEASMDAAVMERESREREGERKFRVSEWGYFGD